MEANKCSICWELGISSCNAHDISKGTSLKFTEKQTSAIMGFLELFVVALMPVLKTLIITVVGLFLAHERVNLLGSSARNHLNSLVFYVFTPAMVASSLAETITASNIITILFMPVNILVTFTIGSALGWILVKINKNSSTTPWPRHCLLCCSL
ncbi:protein PIN-LIKES 4-like isoform X2 [Nicotiana sylvestris]|uniref:protein PIN-LIKES 4-like isoform X2 n=1 Tax=Nicotiana sylvestris TaxID=4096 RepID=UPI00388C8796